MQDINILGLIPARGGSKSIKLKNLHPLLGKPLLSYICEVAEKSKSLSHKAMSSDHKDICSHVINNYKSIDIIKRPKTISTDNSHVKETINQALDFYLKKGITFNSVALLQPTSPFLEPKVLDDLINILVNKPEYNAIQSVQEIAHNSHAFNQRIIDNTDKSVRFYFEDKREKMFNKQKKEKLYKFSNCVITRVNKDSNKIDSVFKKPSLSYLIEDHFSSLDVDSLDEFEIAEALMKHRMGDN
ncbi:hypothetical protein CL656_05180 [bacterium]|nr:hypothetical protein [bacterium]